MQAQEEPDTYVGVSGAEVAMLVPYFGTRWGMFAVELQKVSGDAAVI